MEDELKKLFLTIPDIHGGYSAVIQVSGFETEQEANDYIIKNHKTEELEILNPDKTIH
jgi:calcineurin-like phosphoesterase family protein